MKIQSGFSIKPDAPEAKAAKQDAALKDASKMYESYFLDQMVRAMRSTVNRDNGIMKQNFAEKIFEGQLDSKYVEEWSNKGGVGLADMIYAQISEKVAANGRKPQLAPKGALPITPKKEALGLPAGGADSIQFKAIPTVDPQSKLEYRFEVPNPSGGEFEAQSPMAGRVLSTQSLGEGWSGITLDHGQGIKSEMTFPGRLAEMVIGDEVQTGQRLGVLDSSRPVLAWKLDWT